MNRKKRQKLHKLYDQLPKVKCKGLCTSECTVLGMFPAELVQLTKAAGKAPRLDLKTRRCNLLVDERCSAYEDRPFVCRAWGASASMVCYHGCVPEGGYLDEETEFNLLKKIRKLLGDEPSVFTSTPEEVASVLMTQGLSPQAARELSHRLVPTRR